jgi:hypothetical protein
MHYGQDHDASNTGDMLFQTNLLGLFHGKVAADFCPTDNWE